MKQQLGLNDTQRDDYNRLKLEFDDLQRMTQSMINQEDEYQKRISELEEELNS